MLSEDNPSFLGVHVPGTDAPGILKLLEKTITIGLGAWTTSKDAGNKGVQGDDVVLAANGNIYIITVIFSPLIVFPPLSFPGGVIVGAKFYPSVGLKEYIQKLGTALEGYNVNRGWAIKPTIGSLTGITNYTTLRVANTYALLLHPLCFIRLTSFPVPALSLSSLSSAG